MHFRSLGRRGMTGASAAPAPAEVISLPDERSSIRRRLLQQSARAVAEEAFARGGDYDEDGAYPAAEVAALHESGLLVAVLPLKCGGAGLTGLSLSEILRSIGSGSLPLGRLFEGHVNALELVLCYGNDRCVDLVAAEVRAGKLFGVWNTDDANGLRLIHRHGRSWLEGRKVLASGAGHIERPLVAATDEEGRRLMVLPQAGPGSRRSCALDCPGHARFGNWNRRFHRHRNCAARDRGHRGRLRAATLVLGRRMALRCGASGRHGEAVRSSSKALAGNQSRTGPASAGAAGPSRRSR
jgi:alkylation response protein AidB-like acyl-CoA dehydrogenase